MLDTDLASIYNVTTKALNQAVKRNVRRFPRDFMFRLTKSEQIEVVTNCDHLNYLKFSTRTATAFTEHGALMLANILKSDRAVRTSVQVVRAFIRVRRILSTNVDLNRKLDSLEKKYDTQFKVVFDAIRQLMNPPSSPRREIGFHVRTRGGESKGVEKTTPPSSARRRTLT